MAVLQTKYGLKGTNLPSTLTSTVRNIVLPMHFLRQRFFIFFHGWIPDEIYGNADEMRASEECGVS